MAVAATPEALRWLEAQTGAVLTSGARGISAVDSAGRVRGVVAYDGWTPNAVQAHMAVDTPVAWRALLRPVFEYPFEQAGRRLMLGIIPADNTRSARMAESLGFRLAHRVPDGWSVGVDLLVYQMRREECRYLGRRDSNPGIPLQRRTSSAARQRPVLGRTDSNRRYRGQNPAALPLAETRRAEGVYIHG